MYVCVTVMFVSRIRVPSLVWYRRYDLRVGPTRLLDRRRIQLFEISHSFSYFKNETPHNATINT